MLSRLLGFFKSIVLGNYFGLSVYTDIVGWLERIHTSGIVVGDSSPSAFTPLYNRSRKKLLFFQRISLVIIILSLLVGLTLYIFKGPISSGFITSLDSSYHSMASTLYNIIILNTVLSIFVLYLIGVLMIIDRWKLPAMLGLLSNIITLSVLFIFKDNPTVFYALFISFTVINILFIKTGLSILKKYNLYLSFNFSIFKGIKKLSNFFKMYGPIMSIDLLKTTPTLLYVYIASSQIGYITAFSYASKMYIFPYAIIGVSIIAFLFPLLSRKNKSFVKGKSSSSDLINVFLKIMLLYSLPTMIVLHIFSEPMISFLFERGEFSGEDTLLVSRCLQLLSLQIPFMFVKSLFDRNIVSLLKVKMLTYFQLPMIALSLILLYSMYSIGVSLENLLYIFLLTNCITVVVFFYYQQRIGVLSFKEKDYRKVRRILLLQAEFVLVCGLIYSMVNLNDVMLFGTSMIFLTGYYLSRVMHLSCKNRIHTT
ncbi:MAG: hypothetical protein JJV93_01145 [Alphaproteobacteria bacterium]|nr:hypothetical protein [Alphaproteobacteria bacterium]MBL0717856.1 hypothetical protein [Alphaproteobacteria bacterium]